MAPSLPLGSPNPKDLWAWLLAYEDKTGGQVTAIPHNGNLSNGMMFALQDDFAAGAPYDRNYAETRQKWERLYEVTQLKGDGEAHPLLSNEDEFADYDNWDWGNLDLSAAKTPDMLPGEYARSGLLQRDLARVGYGKGVPMGADLKAAAAGAQAPRFLVYAQRDPIGANLDRVQVIKGWLDAGGKPQEKVFEPKLRAFYYARVIEIPTPRWTAYDRVKFKLDLPADVPLKTQERAYTSPIWYNPQ